MDKNATKLFLSLIEVYLWTFLALLAVSFPLFLPFSISPSLFLSASFFFQVSHFRAPNKIKRILSESSRMINRPSDTCHRPLTWHLERRLERRRGRCQSCSSIESTFHLGTRRVLRVFLRDCRSKLVSVEKVVNENIDEASRVLPASQPASLPYHRGKIFSCVFLFETEPTNERTNGRRYVRTYVRHRSPTRFFFSHLVSYVIYFLFLSFFFLFYFIFFLFSILQAGNKKSFNVGV